MEIKCFRCNLMITETIEIMTNSGQFWEGQYVKSTKTPENY